MWRSVPQTAVAITLRSVSPGPGSGTGTSSTAVASGPAAALVLTTAFIVEGSVIRSWSSARPLVAPKPSEASAQEGEGGSIARLVVPDERSGRFALADLDGLDAPVDDRARPSRLELLEEEDELLLEVRGDRGASPDRKVPERLLERAERLLARLVEELLGRVSGLALVARVVGDPAADRFA